MDAVFPDQRSYIDIFTDGFRFYPVEKKGIFAKNHAAFLYNPEPDINRKIPENVHINLPGSIAHKIPSVR